MNPRVSRSSARWRRKATGFPIAKIAAKLAVGYTLDEIPNDITAKTPASFEPTLDYVVVKVPAVRLREVPVGRRHAHDHDEVASARRWRSAAASPRRCRRRCAPWSSAARSSAGTTSPRTPTSWRRLLERCAGRRPQRLGQVQRAVRGGATIEQLHEATGIDPWFLDQLVLLDEVARSVADAEVLDGRPAARGQAARLLRRADRPAARA